MIEPPGASPAVFLRPEIDMLLTPDWPGIMADKPAQGMSRVMERVVIEDDSAIVVAQALAAEIARVPDDFRDRARVSLLHDDPFSGIRGGLYVFYDRPATETELESGAIREEQKRQSDRAVFDMLREKYGW